MRIWPRILVSLMALGLVLPGRAEQLSNVLKVGVVDGSQPCSYRDGGAWTGLAVELWARVAQRVALPYVLVPMPSINAMLEATRMGRLDVAVECINISPKRLQQYKFSLPFQEDGQAVLVANEPFSLGRAFVIALVSPSLLRMVGLLVISLLLMSAAMWWFEDHQSQVRESGKGAFHQFVMIFTFLLIGDGAADIVTTSNGRAVLMAGYLVRNVSSAALVGFLTVELIQVVQGRASRTFTKVDEIGHLRVAYKPGTVSEELLRELGAIPATSSRQNSGGVPVQSIRSSLNLLQTNRIDGVLADELQLRYLKAQVPASDGHVPVLAISGIRPELQGFGLSPQLPETTVQRINLAISELKRNGVLQQLRQRSLAGEAEHGQSS